MIFAIVAAGGKGKRLDNPTSKQLLQVQGKAILCWSLQALQSADRIDQYIVAYPYDEEKSAYEHLLRNENLGGIQLVPGGEKRFDSVRNAFESIRSSTPEDIVLIHDAARPLVSPALIRAVAEAAATHGAAIPVLPCSDTIKEIRNGVVAATLPRHNIASVQTPQGFRYDLLKAAYQISDERGTQRIYTDESSLVEEAGFDVYCIAGEKRNIKITDREDLTLFDFYLSRR